MGAHIFCHCMLLSVSVAIPGLHSDVQSDNNVLAWIPVPNDERQQELWSRTKHSWVTCIFERCHGHLLYYCLLRQRELVALLFFSLRFVYSRLLGGIRRPCSVIGGCSGTSSITKTRLFKSIENFTTKNCKFSDKNSDILLHFCSKHRLWVLVRTASARRF